MADFLTSYSWMMQSEDSLLSYVKALDACPEGCTGPCWAVSGINSGVFPAQFLAIVAIPQSDRGPAIESFYRTEFWNRWFEQLTSDDLAKRIFDQAVNGGEGTAVRMLQVAINTLAPEQLGVDGKWGPATAAAANACGEELVKAFIDIRCAHYNSIAAANPADKKFLAGWLARAIR